MLLFTPFWRIIELISFLLVFSLPPEISWEFYSGEFQLSSRSLGINRYFRPSWGGSILLGHLL